MQPEEQPDCSDPPHSLEGGVHSEQGSLVLAVDDVAGLYWRGASSRARAARDPIGGTACKGCSYFVNSGKERLLSNAVRSVVRS